MTPLRRAAIVASIAVASAGPVCMNAQSAAPPTPSALRAVQFELHTLSGDTLRVGPHHKATFIAVFATWCRTCKAEISMLTQLDREFAPHGVRVVAVNIDKTTREPVQRWLEANGATYAAALDETGAVARSLGVVGVPEAYLITADGRVVFSRRGPLGSALPALHQAVAQLAGNKP